MNGKEFSTDPINADIEALIRAVASGTAVVFVGAGISKASNLPDWAGLLSKCLNKAEEHSLSVKDNILISSIYESLESIRDGLEHLKQKFEPANHSLIYLERLNASKTAFPPASNVRQLRDELKRLKTMKEAPFTAEMETCSKLLSTFCEQPWKWERTRQLFEEKNFLMVAELLHKGLGAAQLANYIS
ncbi:MAG: hypothetical protein ABL974_21065, partial [Prosthecobacter sp.]